MSIHTIPVDASQTPEEAWREQCEHGQRITYTGGEEDIDFFTYWANINDEEFPA